MFVEVAMRLSRQHHQLAIVCFVAVAMLFVYLNWSTSFSCPNPQPPVSNQPELNKLAHPLATPSSHQSHSPLLPPQNFPPASQDTHAPQHPSLPDPWADSEALRLSEHPDIEVRGKFQKTQIKRMCQTYFFSNERSLLVTKTALSDFHEHLIFEDKRKIIYCYVPKNGCTNMKRLLLYMSDSIPMYTVDWPWVDYHKYLLPAMKKASFLNESLTSKQKEERLANYYKFMVVRHPLERLVSAFRDKLEPPLVYNSKENFPEKVKVAILQKYRPVELKMWKTAVQIRPINISVTFSEFCRYLIETDITEVNEHFVPSMDLCHPCLVQYDFYGNFRNLSTDTTELIKKFDTDSRFYRDESLHKPYDQTRKKLLSYYRRLSHQEKVKLMGRLFDELLFYYTLYPSERNSHQELLGIDTPILT